MARRAPRSWLAVAAVAFLAAHVGSVLFSLMGTATLSAAPNAAPDWDYEALTTHMARLSILTGGGCALSLVAGLWGWVRAGALLLGCAVLAGGAEYLSTVTGFPFGEYAYTSRLGPMFLGRVPYLIPVAWLMVLGPGLVMARHVALGRMESCVLAGLMLTLWDIVLDPIMANELAAWQWSGGGGFYGVPLSNYAAWFVVGSLTAATAVAGGEMRRPDAGGFGIAATLYTAQSLFAGGMAAFHQKHLAVILWALGSLALIVFFERATRPEKPVAEGRTPR